MRLHPRACLLLIIPALPGCIISSTPKTPADRPPVAADDAINTAEDTPVTIDVLANDSDPDEEVITLASVSLAAHGTTSIANGKILYTPSADFNGADAYTYVIGDPAGKAAMGSVSVQVAAVNDPPVAMMDSVMTNEDSPLLIDALAGDFDVDADALTIVSVGTSSNATISISTNGLIAFAPHADFNGSVAFGYSISDGVAGPVSSSVLVSVVPVNDPPVALADAGSTDEEVALVVPAPGVLVNDLDVDSASITAQLVTGPAHGVLVLATNGGYTYTPNTNYSGADAFTYRASDGAATSSTATVTLTINNINDAPVAAPDAYMLMEDSPLTLDAASGVLANDSDVDSASLAASIVTPPAHGALTFSSDGSFTYSPDTNFNGSDSFTYSVSDGSLSDQALVMLTITAVNDAPVAQSDVYYTDVDAQLTTSAVNGVLANDTDVDSALLTASLATMPSSVLQLNSDGSFTYSPSAGFVGTDTFTYTVSDGVATSAAATVSIFMVRNFTISTDTPQIDLVQGTSATLVVTVGATDSLPQPADVEITVAGLPAGVTASPLTIPTGSSGVLMLTSTVSTPQTAWSALSVVGTLGVRTHSVPLQLRVRGAPGSIDTTFRNGVIGLDLGTTGDILNGVAFQPDGKIVLAGSTRISNKPNLLVLRLNDDGSFDPTFASGGKFIYHLGDFGAATNVSVLPSGKILVAAWSYPVGGSPHSSMALLRLNANGGLDTTFAVSGIRQTIPDATSLGLAVLPDGNIIEAGQVSNGSAIYGVVERFLSSGAVDTSYAGGSGAVSVGWDAFNDLVRGFAVDSSGRALLCGGSFNNVSGIARVNSSGLLDTTFNGSGKITVSTGSPSIALGIGVTSSGEIVTAGAQSPGTTSVQDALSIALDDTGARVASYGSNGILTLNDVDNEAATAMGIDESDRIVMVGQQNLASEGRLFVGRYSAAGISDVEFNGGTSYRVLVEGTRAPSANAIGFDADGRILIVGTTHAPSDGDVDLMFVRVWP